MGVVAPAESDVTVPAFTIAIVVVMASLAIWNMFGKLEAGPVPMLEIVAENDSLWPVMPEDGDGVVFPAVRSGGQTLGAVPDTALEYAELPPAFVASTEYECKEPATRPVCV